LTRQTLNHTHLVKHYKDPKTWTFLRLDHKHKIKFQVWIVRHLLIQLHNNHNYRILGLSYQLSTRSRELKMCLKLRAPNLDIKFQLALCRRSELYLKIHQRYRNRVWVLGLGKSDLKYRSTPNHSEFQPKKMPAVPDSCKDLVKE